VRASRPVRIPSRRRSTSQCAIIASAIGMALSLVLLTAHVFAASETLQIIALWLLGGALLAAWISILAWRVPVYGRRFLAAFACLWLVGIALSICLVFLSVDGAHNLLWRRSVQGLALTLSVAVGALFLRALLRVRTSSISGRLLSLVSPIAIFALIVILAATRT
jgi:hypothetical protein